MSSKETGRLIILSGPSGSGKGTVLARCLQLSPQTRLSISATTRAPRTGETDGVQYHYWTREKFEQEIEAGSLLEWTKYNNSYYGTPCAEVDCALADGVQMVLEIEVQGGRHVRLLYPDAVLVFVVPPSFAELRSRLEGRGTEDAQVVAQRLRVALEEFVCAKDYDYILVNDDVEQAARELVQIIEGHNNAHDHNQELLMEVMKDAQTYFVTN